MLATNALGRALGEMRGVTDLELGEDWMTPKDVRVNSLAFLARMPQLERLVLHSLVVNDLDYKSLLTLSKLKKVRVWQLGA